AAIGSLGVPWARYDVHADAVGAGPVSDQGPVAVYQLPGGNWYLLGVGILVTLLALAASGTGRAVGAALTIGPVAGIITALVVVAVANQAAARTADVVAAGVAHLHVTGETAGGVWVGLAAGPLLGFGAGMIALARRRAADRTGEPVSEGSS